jgi:23S rRNA (cytosine1962-C5)-methyltransferase
VKILREEGEEIKGLYERNDVNIRLKEGLTMGQGFYELPGMATPASALTTIVENGIVYEVDVENGQKTGFFLDQKYNRQSVARISKDRQVLDCFTHTGSFGLNAAKGGAAKVTAVDISEAAVQMANLNAEPRTASQRFSTPNRRMSLNF